MSRRESYSFASSGVIPQVRGREEGFGLLLGEPVYFFLEAVNSTLLFGGFSKMHRCAGPFHGLRRILDILVSLKEFRASFDALHAVAPRRAIEPLHVVFWPSRVAQPIRDGARDRLPVSEDLADLSQKHRVYQQAYTDSNR